MLKGYAINQKRLEYLEKTVKLIDIANRIDDRLENNDAKEILKVIGSYLDYNSHYLLSCCWQEYLYMIYYLKFFRRRNLKWKIKT